MYNAELIINGETVDVKRLPVSVLDELVKYFEGLEGK